MSTSLQKLINEVGSICAIWAVLFLAAVWAFIEDQYRRTSDYSNNKAL
jgi:hypothetical protein